MKGNTIKIRDRAPISGENSHLHSAGDANSTSNFTDGIIASSVKDRSSLTSEDLTTAVFDGLEDGNIVSSQDKKNYLPSSMLNGGGSMAEDREHVPERVSELNIGRQEDYLSSSSEKHGGAVEPIRASNHVAECEAASINKEMSSPVETSKTEEVVQKQQAEVEKRRINHKTRFSHMWDSLFSEIASTKPLASLHEDQTSQASDGVAFEYKDIYELSVKVNGINPNTRADADIASPKVLEPYKNAIDSDSRFSAAVFEDSESKYVLSNSLSESDQNAPFSEDHHHTLLSPISENKLIHENKRFLSRPSIQELDLAYTRTIEFSDDDDDDDGNEDDDDSHDELS